VPWNTIERGPPSPTRPQPPRHRGSRQRRRRLRAHRRGPRTGPMRIWNWSWRRRQTTIGHVRPCQGAAACTPPDLHALTDDELRPMQCRPSRSSGPSTNHGMSPWRGAPALCTWLDVKRPLFVVQAALARAGLGRTAGQEKQEETRHQGRVALLARATGPGLVRDDRPRGSLCGLCGESSLACSRHAVI
jgi:hypothetical protein